MSISVEGLSVGSHVSGGGVPIILPGLSMSPGHCPNTPTLCNEIIQTRVSQASCHSPPASTISRSMVLWLSVSLTLLGVSVKHSLNSLKDESVG